MKKILIFSLLLIQTTAWSCDICGCANGGAYFGIMPQIGRPFVGLRYRMSSYDSHLNSKLLRTKETFRATELWARFYPAKRIQVLAFAPYYFNHQQDIASGVVRRLQGLGDITLLGNYNLFNTFWDSTRVHRVNHSLLVGAGLKVPTGRFRYNQTEVSEVNNPNFQLGTGSVDVLLSALYSMRIGSWGWNTDLTYKVNSTNVQEYRFGNRLTANSLIFYTKELSHVTLMPNAGMYAEVAAQDFRDGVRNRQTGGYVTMANTGLEVYLKRFSIGATYQLPVIQNLADHELKARSRGTLHVTLML